MRVPTEEDGIGRMHGDSHAQISYKNLQAMKGGNDLDKKEALQEIADEEESDYEIPVDAIDAVQKNQK